ELRELLPTVVHFSGFRTSGAADAGGSAERPHRDVVVQNGPVDPEEHGLYFSGSGGRTQLASAEALARVFAGSPVGVVVLSGCYSDALAAALLVHVDCVIGTPDSIGADAARSFAIGFYAFLGERASVARAFQSGLAAINLDGLADSDRARLRVRDGV